MPKEAKVFLVDRDKKFRNLVKEMLTDYGHTVVLEASSLSEALEKIKQTRGKGVDVGIIDDSLGVFRYTPSNGHRIANELRRKIPDVKIISLTSWSTNWSDENLDKMRIRQIGKIVMET